MDELIEAAEFDVSARDVEAGAMDLTVDVVEIVEDE